MSLSPPVAVPANVAAVAEERRVFAKIGARLMPLLIVSYILNYLDRTNVSFASLTRSDTLGLTTEQYGYGFGIFFLGYCFLELPSNMVLYKVGARRWISRIMISWGIVSAAMSFAVGPYSFYALRFLLGAAEAGFFPGIAFYLSTWFPSEYRTRIIAWFMVAIPLSTAIGAPMSSVPLIGLDGVGGLAGWQWMFIIEGLPVVVLGIALLWLLPDRPEDASWLSDDERRIVSRRLESERKPKEVRRLSAALKDVRVWMLAGVQFSFLVGSYGALGFVPLIFDRAGLTKMENGLLTGGVYACAVVAMILWARHVDRGARKITHLMLACLVSAAGFVGFGFTLGDLWTSVFFITIAVIGVNGARAIFWTIPPRFLSGLAAAGGLAFINSIGTMGGQVGPAIMGKLEKETGTFTAGTLAMAGFLLLAATIAWRLSQRVRREKNAAADL
jgi:MFS transporter, ACS family, tartrate transporter